MFSSLLLLGMPDNVSFDTSDLYEEKDFALVLVQIDNLYALASRVGLSAPTVAAHNSAPDLNIFCAPSQSSSNGVATAGPSKLSLPVGAGLSPEPRLTGRKDPKAKEKRLFKLTRCGFLPLRLFS
jgi:hypothetical protein